MSKFLIASIYTYFISERTECKPVFAQCQLNFRKSAKYFGVDCIHKKTIIYVQKSSLDILLIGQVAKTVNSVV